MATLLDTSLLDQFQIVFVVLFIFVAVYAILTFKQPFGGSKGVNGLLAFTIAILFIFVPQAVEVVKSSIPWYVVMMIALMFVLMITQSFNASIPSSVMTSIGTWILIIAIVIFILNVSLQLGQGAGPFLGSNNITDPDNVIAGGEGDVASGSFSQNLGATLFHPKVLAFILIIVISAFAVLWIGYTV